MCEELKELAEEDREIYRTIFSLATTKFSNKEFRVKGDSNLRVVRNLKRDKSCIGCFSEEYVLLELNIDENTTHHLCLSCLQSVVYEMIIEWKQIYDEAQKIKKDEYDDSWA